MTTNSSVEQAVADAAVREEVLATTRSFIVQAPAGSGKTELLMQRFLALLATVDEPEAVLAITFTIKAASEMRNRIVAALAAAHANEPVAKSHLQKTRTLALEVLARDRERGWHLLQNPGRLQIRTVDSFCESLARRSPLRAGLGGPLNITEVTSPLYDEAARRTLDLLGSEDESIAAAMMTLLAHVDADVLQLQRLCFNMLEKRDRWLRLVAATKSTELNELRRTLEKSLEAAVRDEVRGLRARWKAEVRREEELELLRLARFATTTPEVEEQYRQFASWKDVPGAELDDLPAWCVWAEWLLTGAGKWRSDARANLGFPAANGNAQYRRAKDEYKAALQNFREEQREALRVALARAGKLPQPRYSDEQWGLICALFRILPLAVENLQAVFVERGVMDFTQLSQAAIAALGGSSASAIELRHVLVDEFQDTSATQVELLARLTAEWHEGDGHTLFVVGDPMQSIYAFREAEVVLFERTKTQGVRGLKLDSRKLEVNFRSQERLVSWFNETFDDLLTDTNDLRGAVRYEKCSAVQPAIVGAPAEVHPFYNEDPLPEAEHVVSLVRDALTTTDGDVAILVRARTHLPAIVEALRRAGIPYRGVELDALNTRQAVLDVDALAQALEHVGNRAAWLAVLRAPWCGLTLADLWQLCGGEKYTPVVELMRARLELLSEDARRRVARVLPVLESAVARYGREPLRPLLERTWVSLGGPAAVRAGVDGEADLRDVGAYFELVQPCEVAGALPERTIFKRRMEQLYAAPDTSDGIRVEIMTIYAAKGLEFDTVIVPGLGRAVGGDGQALLYWRERVLEGETRLLLAPMQAVSPEEEEATLESYLQRIERDRNREEGKRLLYVAATRAKRKLHLLGHVNASGKADTGSLLALLMVADQVADVFRRYKPEPAAAEAGEPLEMAAAAEGRAAPVLRRLPIEWEMPSAPIGVSTMAVEVGEAAEPHTFRWVSDTLRRTGTVTHAFLQQIAREGLEAWTEQRIEKSDAMIRVALMSEGVPPVELGEAAEKVSRALRSAVTDERGRWILSKHAEAESEFEVSGVLDGRVVRAKIDRTFIDEEGTRWIIDYKTAAMEGASVERFVDLQEEKYRPDLQRYARLMSALEARPVRAGLYLPLLNRWRVVPLDAGREED